MGVNAQIRGLNMSFDKDRPNFYDETVIHPGEHNVVASHIKTKVFDQREAIDTAKPDENNDQSNIRPWRVSFSIQTSKVELVFEVNNSIYVGRSTRPEQPFEGIDLSPFNGYELGVSRLHAEINLQNEQITLTDKGSANGTLLNQQRLKKDTPYMVKNGDEIRFGNMSVYIYFLTPIFQASHLS